MQGTFFINKSGETTWRVMVRTYGNGGEKTKTVPKIAWAELGFHASMTMDQAKARAKQLNAQATIERNKSASVARIAQRISGDDLSHSAFIPSDLNQKFLEVLDENISGKAAQEKARSRWASIKKMIITLQLKPENYSDKQKVIFGYFETRKYSLDYIKRLLFILNLYGRTVSKLRGQFYEKVPNPRRVDASRINKAYFNSKNYKGPSDPLTPQILNGLREKLEPKQWNWLHCTLWLGLRPSELTVILKGRNDKRWYLAEHEGVDVLMVFQEKLTTHLPDDKCWKPIVLYYQEQRDAYATLLKGEATKPLNKTIQRYTTGAGYFTTYCGRKGFTDLMLGKGQSLEDIAQWMGHTSIQMTWSKYKSRTKLRIVKV